MEEETKEKERVNVGGVETNQSGGGGGRGGERWRKELEEDNKKGGGGTGYATIHFDVDS